MGRAAIAAILLLLAASAEAQRTPATDAPEKLAAEAPLPDIRALLLDVERNQKTFERAQDQYTYHVHVETRQMDGHGAVKKTSSRDSESLAISGVRVNRLLARNGKPLSEDEARKEGERIDKEVAKAKAAREKREAKGEPTDERGDVVIPASRILELGSFSNPRRELLDGRPAIVADYNGDPNAKTHSAAEGIIRVLTGTVWIDEKDRALVRAHGVFRDDFKIAGGLLLSVHKGLTFDFRATNINGEVWLPASIDGVGGFRALLFESFDGESHWRMSDYRKFRASATILPGTTEVGPDGKPVPEPPQPESTPK